MTMITVIAILVLMTMIVVKQKRMIRLCWGPLRANILTTTSIRNPKVAIDRTQLNWAACVCVSTGRGRVQRKWVQPENVMFAQSLARSRPSGKNPVKSVKIRQNPAKSVKIRQNPAKSVKIRQNPAVPTWVVPSPDPLSVWDNSSPFGSSEALIVAHKLPCQQSRRCPVWVQKALLFVGPRQLERKRHININLFGRWPLRWGGSFPAGCPRGKVLCTVLRTQGIQAIFPGYPVGRIGDQGDRQEFYVKRLMCRSCSLEAAWRDFLHTISRDELAKAFKLGPCTNNLIYKWLRMAYWKGSKHHERRSKRRIRLWEPVLKSGYARLCGEAL